MRIHPAIVRQRAILKRAAVAGPKGSTRLAASSSTGQGGADPPTSAPPTAESMHATGSSSASGPAIVSSEDAAGAPMALAPPVVVDVVERDRGKKQRRVDRFPRLDLDGRPARDGDVGDAYLRLSYNPDGSCDMRAICVKHEQCTMSRTCRAGRSAAQGRPAAFLWQWLKRQDDFCSKGDHRNYEPSYPERRLARLELQHNPNSKPWLDSERPVGEHDDDVGEPHRCT